MCILHFIDIVVDRGGFAIATGAMMNCLTGPVTSNQKDSMDKLRTSLSQGQKHAWPSKAPNTEGVSH